MMSATTLTASEPSQQVRTRSSRASAFWRQLSHHPAGLVGLVTLALIVVLAILAPVVVPSDPYTMNRIESLQGPSWGHPMGTDELGRDLFSRVVHGARTSLLVATVSVIIATVIGTPIGIVAGYFESWVDSLLMRIMDVVFAFPALLLALAITAFLGPSLRNATLALGIVYAPGFARIVRGPVLSAKHQEYVEASRVSGAGHLRILVHHLLPNILSPLIVTATVTFSFALLAEAALSFLGLGAQPPEPSWGAMLSGGRRFMETVPSLAIFPGVAIMITVLATNLLGDALRDVLDPRLRR